MFSGFVEILTQPGIHVEGIAMMFFVDSFLRYYKEIGYLMATMYCSCYGISTALLSTHFCYRYLSVCRPQTVRYLTGMKLFLMFLPAIFCGVIFFVTIALCSKPTEMVSEILKESFEAYYNENIYETLYLAGMYFYYDKNNQIVFNWTSCTVFIVLSLIMTSSITTTIVFASKTYKFVQSYNSTMSTATRDLHRQLFYTLVLQSIVPFVILFLPVVMIFPLSFFEVPMGYLPNSVSAGIGIYPAIDAIIAIYMIRDFRDAFLCRQRRSVKVNIESQTIV